MSAGWVSEYRLAFKVVTIAVYSPQFGNFRIFLSLMIYVKSILKNLEVLKMPYVPFYGALKFVYLVKFILQKVHKFTKSQNSVFKYKNDRFFTSRISKIDFPYNLNDRKIMKFSHCAANTDDFTTLLHVPLIQRFFLQ